jgi:hypothetical protein
MKPMRTKFLFCQSKKLNEPGIYFISQESTIEDDTKVELERIFKTKISDLPKIDQATTDTEAELLAKYKKVYNISNLFPEFIKTNFNTRMAYNGPNCHNTALNVIGHDNAKRYTHYVELEYYLRRDFRELYSYEKPEFGDLVVYYDWGEIEHSAIYISETMVFHKAGQQRYYGYHFANLEDPFIELSEEDKEASPSADLTYKIYRKTNITLPEPELTLLQKSYLNILEFYNSILERYVDINGEKWNKYGFIDYITLDNIFHTYYKFRKNILDNKINHRLMEQALKMEKPEYMDSWLEGDGE